MDEITNVLVYCTIKQFKSEFYSRLPSNVASRLQGAREGVMDISKVPATLTDACNNGLWSVTQVALMDHLIIKVARFYSNTTM